MAIRRNNPIDRAYRHINRYREILAVLVKYGFGEFLAKHGGELDPEFNVVEHAQHS